MKPPPPPSTNQHDFLSENNKKAKSGKEEEKETKYLRIYILYCSFVDGNAWIFYHATFCSGGGGKVVVCALWCYRESIMHLLWCSK